MMRTPPFTVAIMIRSNVRRPARIVAVFAAALAAAVVAASANAADLTVLCAGALKTPVSALLAKRDPSSVAVTYATAGVIRDRIAKGERPDVVIVPSEDAFSMMKRGLLNVATRRALGTTEVGVAVRSGAPIPDIRTKDALRATLLAARKVVIVDPAKGSSGLQVENLFKELRIDDAMRAKTLMLDGGNVVEAVARGEADLGLQQISEILPVAGVKLVGPLPGDLQRLTRYDIAALNASKRPKEAEALVRDLSSNDAHVVIEKSGFMSAR